MQSDTLDDSIYFAAFDKTVRLSSEHEEAEYDKRCIAAFFAWDETVLTKLRDASFAYYKGYQELTEFDAGIDSPEKIWEHCDPLSVTCTSSNEDSNSTFISIELNCDWEIEHGMQWIVKNNDEPLYVGPYYGVSVDSVRGSDEGGWNYV